MLFCFFKQKTAYEMRISDWSSDVCSSDLGNGGEKERAWTRRRIVIDRPHWHGRRWMGEVCRSVIKLFGYGQGEAMGGGPLRNHVTFFGKGIARTVQYDRKIVGKGTSVSVRVDLCGRRLITKKRYKYMSLKLVTKGTTECMMK